MQAAVLAKAGDWAWFKQALNLKSWSGEGEFQRICWLCEGAKLGPCPCYDFSRTAAWRKSRVDDKRHWELEHASGGFISPIFAIPGFSISYCQPDFMHTCDMGIVQYCTGNCMWEVFLELHGVRTRSTVACAKLENMVKLASKALGTEVPFQGLTVNMIRKQGPGTNQT